MVRHVKDTPATWKAMLAISVAAGALLWHLLACTESPMAFSPDGKDLAFVTAEPAPFGEKALPVKGKQVYRLMVLGGGKKLRVVEQTSDEMLTAPAYSPDGKQVCYLRIKLRTAEEMDAAEKRIDGRTKQWEKLKPTRPSGDDLPATEDLTLPPVEDAVELIRDAAVGEPLPAALVVRDAKTWKVVSTTRVDFPAGTYEGEALSMMYSLIRPQYSPDGKWIYYWDTQAAVAVDIQAKKRRTLAAPARIPTLSPDGKTLAIYMQEAIGLVGTDGQVATYRRLKGEVSPLGMTWKDKQTLVLLMEVPSDKDREKSEWRIQLLKTDGTVAKSIPLKLPESEMKDVFLEIALAPKGGHMVVCSGTGVLFMKADGKVLKHWTAGDEQTAMFRPTFAPDSKRVAFKYMTERDKLTRVSAIVFFTPEGKEVARVAIPAAKPPASKPAGEGP